MTNVIMHGCNGKMGKNIANLIKEDEDVTLVAGIDAFDEGKNPFPVFTDINECDVAADVIIDFSAAPAIDGLLDYCVAKQIPCVLCTTGLSKEQLYDCMDKTGIDRNVRAEQLSMEQLIEFSNELSGNNNSCL